MKQIDHAVHLVVTIQVNHADGVVVLCISRLLSSIGIFSIVFNTIQALVIIDLVLHPINFDGILVIGLNISGNAFIENLGVFCIDAVDSLSVVFL